MLPLVNDTQNIYIEITNLRHGGLGWELGTCLWSPKFDSSSKKAWKLMEQVKINDIILHLVKLNNHYHFYGVSKVCTKIIETRESPPLPDKWENMIPYQRINLTNFNKIPKPFPVSEIFNIYETRLRNIKNDNIEGQFYNLYQNQLRVSQRYFAICPPELYQIFDEITNFIDFTPIIKDDYYDNVPTLHEPQNPDYTPPSRVQTVVTRIIRDTKLSRNIKSEHNWKCQVCGKSILLPNGFNYSEGHHLKPLGGEHQGPDISGNIIIVCPYHHTEFDYGSIAINPITNLIEHIDPHNVFHHQQLAYTRTDVDEEFIKYHYEKRFNQL
ncbi:hypothetical protein F3J23_15005 [Chryseobacterium sp. Tr-659]|uniref:HNH endonuclease n=1 Tax=Chryseobacterium sp. Tr-659 TaxID=2608340 RepID=UPI00141F3D0B|nr:HNH endonuclease [Chryseobacterium sp. Tr-659]NIF06754.1 hypothetical protein [Chryseobacterium sp. Tr-659]